MRLARQLAAVAWPHKRSDRWLLVGALITGLILAFGRSFDTLTGRTPATMVGLLISVVLIVIITGLAIDRWTPDA